MIERYRRPAMGAIWEENAKFARWLEIETLACEGMARYGIIPEEAARAVREKGAFEIPRIEEIEAVTHHDVIAFLTNVAEHVGEASRYVHLGMTSSDILDTGLAMAMKEAGGLLLDEIDRMREILRRRALEFKDTPCIGRSHGIHAEPTTFGLKLLLWYEEMGRNRARLERAVETVSVGQISGAVGTLAHVDPRVEEYVCEKLGLSVAKVSTQVLQRDRHAEFMTTLAVIASTLDKMGTELRNLQRTDILEVEEAFGKGQKGSSSMPHKRNPITLERLSGLARLLRGYAISSIENVALWHERDISHSSVERVILPDSTIILNYMFHRLIPLLDGLLVYPKNMITSLSKTRGLIYSQRVLLELMKKGLTREQAYEIIQRCAMQVWQETSDFKEVLCRDRKVRKYLKPGEIEGCFDIKYYTRHRDMIYKRVGLK